MLCLFTNPRPYKKLMAELDEAIENGNIPLGPRDVISDSQAKSLPYLQAVIKEVSLGDHIPR